MNILIDLYNVTLGRNPDFPIFMVLLVAYVVVCYILLKLGRIYRYKIKPFIQVFYINSLRLNNHLALIRSRRNLQRRKAVGKFIMAFKRDMIEQISSET